MPAARRTADEQYQLIMECRTSGLSDFQWCTEHDINPGTFYNWVKRLRRKACYEIPEPAGRLNHAPSAKQEVVLVDIVPNDIQEPQSVTKTQTQEKSLDVMQPNAAPITIEIANASISIQNTIDPQILMQLLQFIGVLSC